MGRGYCFLCGAWGQTERHHIFGGARRPLSEKYGLTVELCHRCHQESPDSAHRSGETKLALHKFGEMQAIREQGWTVEEFREKFDKNYLEEDEIEMAYESAMEWQEIEADEEVSTWEETGFRLTEDRVLLPY